MKIGITGHQQREGIDWGWVEATLEFELDGRQVDAVYSSLAIGSDQLFVSVALRRALPIIGVIPFEGYERTFKDFQKKSYLELRDACEEVIVLNWPGNDEAAYLNAGKWIVSATDLLFAIWDGKQADGIGGTADIVKFARERGNPVLHMNPIDRFVRLLST